MYYTYTAIKYEVEVTGRGRLRRAKSFQEYMNLLRNGSFYLSYVDTESRLKSCRVMQIYKGMDDSIVGVDVLDLYRQEVLVGVPYRHFLDNMIDRHTYLDNIRVRHGRMIAKEYLMPELMMRTVAELKGHYDMSVRDVELVLYPCIYNPVDGSPLYGKVAEFYDVGKKGMLYGEQYRRITVEGSSVPGR